MREFVDLELVVNVCFVKNRSKHSCVLLYFYETEVTYLYYSDNLVKIHSSR